MQTVTLLDSEHLAIRTPAGPIIVSVSIIGARGPVIFITPDEGYTVDRRCSGNDTLTIERERATTPEYDPDIHGDRGDPYEDADE